MFTARLVPILTLAAAAIVHAQAPYGTRYPAEKSAFAPLPDNSRMPLYGGSPQATPTPTPTPAKVSEKPAHTGQPIIINNNNGGPYGGYYPPMQSSGFSSSFSTPGWVSGNFSMPPWNSTVTAWSSGPAYGPSNYGQQPFYGNQGYGNQGYGNQGGYPSYGNHAHSYPTYIPGPAVQGYRGAAGPGFGGNCSQGTTIGGGGITFTWRGR